MLIAGVLFDIGVVFITVAWSLWVLIVGRVLLGIAVAFASVAVTLYNSEMAPAHIRGRLNQIFQVRLQAASHTLDRRLGSPRRSIVASSTKGAVAWGHLSAGAFAQDHPFKPQARIECCGARLT